MKYLAPIVEGHGEIEALPALIYRIARHENFQGHVRINPPIRVKSGSFLNDTAYFTKHVTAAALKAVQADGAVLILLDCDDDCPAKLGPRIQNDARAVRSDVKMIVALAYREFESWFLAAAESLGGRRGLPKNLVTPVNLDSIRNAKGWLGKRMDVSYDPITHLIEFVREFDLRQARSSQSFNRFYCRIHEFLLS